MRTLFISLFTIVALAAQPALADNVDTAIENFRGAHGEGEVFVGGKKVGKTKMSQITYGLQLGGQVYSQMIFFRDERAFDDFTSGIFEFGAQARTQPSRFTG